MYPTNHTNHNNKQKTLVNNNDSIREIILLPYTQRVHGNGLGTILFYVFPA